MGDGARLDTIADRSYRSRGQAFLAASILTILLATLTPAPWTELDSPPLGRNAGIADMLLNAILFMPLGAALGLRGRGVGRAWLLGALLSGAIELIQSRIPGRVASGTDLVFNGVGTIAGWILWRTSATWIRPDARAAGRLALVAAAAATAIVGLTGFLLGPSFPATRYYGGWAQEFGHLRTYRGQVLHASVGGTTIPSGAIPHSPEVQTRLLAGQTLLVRAVAGPPPSGLAPILSIHDEYQREIVLLGADRTDLVYRFRTRAAVLGFDSPELRVPGTLSGIRPGDLLVVTVDHEGGQYRIEVNGVAARVGFTAGMGWTLLLYGQGLPLWMHPVLSMSWMVGLAFPVGYWARFGWVSLLAVVPGTIAFVLVPHVSGLAVTPPTDMVAGLVGLLIGLLPRRTWRPRTAT
jgi:VanZ family protein